MRIAALGNQYLAEQAPWTLLESDRERAGTILYVALRAVDSLKILLAPYLPFSAQRLHELLGYDDVIAGPLEFRTVDDGDGSEHVVLTGDYESWAGRWEPSALPAGSGAARAAAALREARSRRRRRRGARADGSRAPHDPSGVTDSHAHLDACDEPAAALVERAQDAGVTRIVTIGTGIESCRRALAIAEAHEGVFAVSRASTRTRPPPPRPPACDELRELLAHEKAVAVGETGLDNVREHATPGRPAAAPRRPARARGRARPAVVIHSREAAAETAAALEGFAGTVILHCFSSPELLPAALERGYYVSFAGNATYPKAPELREAAAAVPPDRILVETDSPYLSPQPVRGRRNEPAHVVHTVAALAEARGEDVDALAARTHANAAAAFGLDERHAEEVARPALPRGREHARRHRAARRPRARGRCARGRPGPRSAHALPRGPRRARPRGRARPHARGGAPRDARRTRERRPRLRRRARARPRRARPRAVEARREPPVQRRDADRRREPREHSRRSSAGA